MLTSSQQLANMLNAAARAANKDDILGFVDINGAVECLTKPGRAAEGRAFVDDVQSIKLKLNGVYHVDFHIADVYEADTHPEHKSRHVLLLQAALESAGLGDPVLVVPGDNQVNVDTEGDAMEVRAALAMLLYSYIPVFDKTLVRQANQLVRIAIAPIVKTGRINRVNWARVNSKRSH
jgi:hypothetical protein